MGKLFRSKKGHRSLCNDLSSTMIPIYSPCLHHGMKGALSRLIGCGQLQTYQIPPCVSPQFIVPICSWQPGNCHKLLNKWKTSIGHCTCIPKESQDAISHIHKSQAHSISWSFTDVSSDHLLPSARLSTEAITKIDSSVHERDFLEAQLFLGCSTSKEQKTSPNMSVWQGIEKIKWTEFVRLCRLWQTVLTLNIWINLTLLKFVCCIFLIAEHLSNLMRN